MHRWGQSQMFRSLAFYLTEERKRQQAQAGPESDSGRLLATNGN